MGKLFDELKRRKVFRVAAVYAVVAWVLIQVADTVLPALQMPAWTISFVTILFILGFPIALILAWAYEVTPNGVTTDSGIHRAETPPTSNTDRKLIYATFVLLLLAVSFQMADRFIFGRQPEEAISRGDALSSDDAQVLRSSILLGQPLIQRNNPPFRSLFDISADGASLFYLNLRPPPVGTQLFVRNMAVGTTKLFGESPYAGTPRVSPDGRRITSGYSISTLRIGDVQTGLWQDIALPKRAGPAVAWLSNDEVIYSAVDQSLHRYSLSTGEDAKLTQAVEEFESHQWPQVLPGQNAFLFSSSSRVNGAMAWGGALDSSVNIHDLLSGTSRTLIARAYGAKYAPSGHVVFVRSGDLIAVPFDLENLEIIGQEARVVEGVSSQPYLGIASYAFSDLGRLVYLPGEEMNLGQTGFLWTDRSGNSVDVQLPIGSYRDPELSPDGQSLALTNYQIDGSSDIWVFDLARQTLGRRTFQEHARNPKWSPDGTLLVYTVNGEGIWSSNADGTGQAEQLVTEATARPDSFTGNGNDLLYLTGAINYAKVNRLSYSDSSWQSTPLMPNQVNTWGVVVSPDGRWISYVSDETGRQEIFVRPYPAVDDGKWQISAQGGREPIWGVEGDELYFLQFDGTLLSVAIETGNGFEPGNPQVLLTGFAVNGSDPPSYDVSNDGQRFIRYPPVIAEDTAPELVTAQGNAVLAVVENWFEELKRLAPPDPQ